MMNVTPRKTLKFSVIDAVDRDAPSTPTRTPTTVPSRPVKTPKSSDTSTNVGAEDDRAIPAKLELFKDDEGSNKTTAPAAPPSADSEVVDEDTNTVKDDKEQVVTPWTVQSEGAVDYDKLIRDFGCHHLTKGTTQ